MALKKKAPETVVFHGTTTGAWAVPKTRKSTNEQREVIGTAGNLVTVTAYAGTGKTTTLHEFARARHSEKMLYLVFNRSMAEDAKRAFKDCANVSISTIHALAFRFYGRDYQRKLGNIRPHDLRRYLQKRNMPHSYEAVSSLFHIVQTFLMSADADPAATVARLKPDRRREIAERGLDAQKLVDAATEVWADIRAQELPMPHNGYLKMLQLNPVPLNVDRILVDEAQDISDCVIDIVAGSGKKLLLVGDPYQQIYGWNGAVDALAKMSGNGATSYYLTQSFRCPNDVAGAADVYLQALNAPKTFRGAPQLLPPQGPEAVIARTNLGLFDEIVSANPAKTNIYYTGGFESYEYRSLVDIYRLKNNERHKVRDTFIGSFEEFEEFVDYAENAADGSLKAKINIVKKYDHDLPDIFRHMKRKEVPRTAEADLIVSTAHRAKGREFSAVRLHGDFIDIGDITKRASVRKGNDPITVSAEELHLIYVAVTRSKKRLSMPAYLVLDNSVVQKFKEQVALGHIKLV